MFHKKNKCQTSLCIAVSTFFASALVMVVISTSTSTSYKVAALYMIFPIVAAMAVIYAIESMPAKPTTLIKRLHAIVFIIFLGIIFYGIHKDPSIPIIIATAIASFSAAWVYQIPAIKEHTTWLTEQY